MTASSTKQRRRLPILQGVLPIDRKQIPTNILAGVTLAALAIPEVMGYTSIAGMPVITGLYTILLPMLAFAVFGSSRHLVVGADSATAAVMAAGLIGLAQPGSDHYVALAGLLALMAAGFLLLARVIRLGFLANFLSRSVLIGFLTGVGIQVACGQVGGLLGVPEGKGITINGDLFDNTITKLISTLQNVGSTSWATVAVSAGVLVVILGGKFVTKKVPGALVAVIGAIVISWHWDLVSHGIATLGAVPGGLPKIGIPSGLSFSDVPSLMGTAVSIFILILAQSAATSRAYAAKYNDKFDENVDLVGLGTANIFAGLTGTFVVNGSPTKTEMVDGAGGRSQLAQITTGLIVLIVLLFLTAPLEYMPKAVLAAVVFMIGIQLVDIKGMRSIFRVRKDEFVVAVLTAATVVLLGVEQGIVLAIVASVIGHLRRSYKTATAVMIPDDNDTGLHSTPFDPSTRTAPGVAVYRFASDLFYVNANLFLEDLTALANSSEPLQLIVLDSGAITDIDFTGSLTIKQVLTELSEHNVKLVFADAMTSVRHKLDRYDITQLVGDDAFYPTVGSALRAADSNNKGGHQFPDSRP
jgi:high affinity sulfate transporter 1